MNAAEKPIINGILVPNPDGEYSATRPYLVFASLPFQSTLYKPKSLLKNTRWPSF